MHALNVHAFERQEEEELELEGVDGDCKEDSEEINKYQLLANMNKCAADIAFSASKRLLVFNKITVHGMLVDYKPAKICKVYKLIFDFKECKGTLHKCEKVHLDIADGFSRAISLLKQSDSLQI